MLGPVVGLRSTEIKVPTHAAAAMTIIERVKTVESNKERWTTLTSPVSNTLEALPR